MRSFVLSLAASLALAGCGGSGTLPSGSTRSAFHAEGAREAARRSPTDPARLREAAILETLAPDGDPTLADGALDRAIERAPNDGALRVLRSLVRGSHAELRAADDDVLDAIDRLRTSDDPLGPALAEVAVASVSIDVGVAARTDAIRERLRAAFAEPGNLGAVAVSMIGDALVDDALRRGDVPEARRVVAAMGCVPDFRVAGPFGPRELLGFDTSFPAEGTGPLAAQYDLGPTRGVRPTRTLRTDRCAVFLGTGTGDEAGPGTTYAEAFVEVPSDGDQVLLVDTPNPAIVRVDGVVVASIDRRRETGARFGAYRLNLSHGRHEIEVKVSSRHPNPFLSVRLVGPRGLALGTDAGGGSVALEAPQAGSALASFVRARVLLGRGDAVGARRAIAPLLDDGHGSPLVLETLVEQLYAEPIRPEGQANDQARHVLDELLSREPRAFVAPLELAQMDADENRVPDAMRRLREGADRFPEAVIFGMRLVQLLEARGVEDEASERLATMLASHPEHCGLVALARARAQRLGRTLAWAELAERAVACDARSTARLERLLAARDWAGAEREVDRLDALRLDGWREARLPLRIRIARNLGDASREQALEAEFDALDPRGTGSVRREVDSLVARGRIDEALSAIDRAVAEEPRRRMQLQSLQDGLALRHVMEPYRVDGASALREYRESGVRYASPIVYVLDYGASLVFENGAYVHLVHQIIQVNSEDALDDVGEFHPQGELLSVRTIKQDGRVLEPDSIHGLEQLALPRLEIGDFVEYEFVLIREPSIALEGGVVADRFFFQTFDGPMHRTEYLVVHASDVPVVFDERGGVSAPSIETRDGLRLVRYRLDRQPKREEEPFSVAMREFVPSVAWGVGASWRTFVGAIADQLADVDVRDPDLAELAARVVREAHARTPREKARALYAWVQQNVEDEGSGLFESAPGMLYDRNGHRDRVYRYVLGLVGIRAELVLIQPVTADQTRSELPEDGVYDAAGLRIRFPDGDQFVTASQKGVPFGWLPFEWLGQPGVVVASEPESVTLPATSPVPDDQDIRIEGSMDDEGFAELVVTERMTGSVAGRFREMLKQIPAAELEMRFDAGYVAPRFSNASLRALRITGLDDAERPLVLRYEISGPLAYPTGEGLELAMPLPFGIGGALGATPSREVAMLLPTLHQRITLSVSLPESVEARALPPASRLEGPGGSFFSTRATSDDGTLRVERELSLRTVRVPAAEYPRVAAFSRGADREETRPIALHTR